MEFEKPINLDKFDGTNFKQWKFQIKCALHAKGLDVNTPKPENNATQWNKDDGMAMYFYMVYAFYTLIMEKNI